MSDYEKGKVLFGDEHASLKLFEKFSSPDLYDLLQPLPYMSYDNQRPGKEKTRSKRKVLAISDLIPSVYISSFTDNFETIKFDQAPFIEELIKDVNTRLGTEFNLAFLNHYSDGNVVIFPHSDDLTYLHPEDHRIAIVAFGPGERHIKFYHREQKGNNKKIGRGIPFCKVKHRQGDLLLMDGNFQNKYKHGIDPEIQVEGERISITLRHYQIGKPNPPLDKEAIKISPGKRHFSIDEKEDVVQMIKPMNMKRPKIFNAEVTIPRHAPINLPTQLTINLPPLDGENAFIGVTINFN